MIESGLTRVVDVDLDRFFDRVNHDALMARVARRVGDRRILGLIRRYLDAEVMVGGVAQAREAGTPQGSPLSPLLANIMLDDLDQLLERRGHAFVRYADDLRVYVASERAAARVLAGVTVFVEQRLHLRVNQAKSGIAPATVRGLLGFGFLRNGGHGEDQARAQDEGSSEGSTAPAHRPPPLDRHARAARAGQPVPRGLGHLLRAGRHALGVRRGRRMAPPPEADLATAEGELGRGDTAATRAITSTGAVADIPGIVAVDGAPFTEITRPIAFTFDAAGRLSGLVVTARNTNVTAHDLFVVTEITLHYDDVPTSLPKAEPTWLDADKPLVGK